MSDKGILLLALQRYVLCYRVNWVLQLYFLFQ